MNQLTVELLKTGRANAAINEVSFLMDGIPSNVLQHIPWTQYDYHPAVSVAMAYGEDSVFLKYYVHEKFLRAANGAINGAVWEDSCVEFFLSFDDEPAYYNFEFNCIGTALVGYGESNTGRSLLPHQLLSQIKYQAVINNDRQDNEIQWELTVAIPLTVFCYHQPVTLKGKRCKANFYKCGDLLPTPHFVSWSNIQAPEPNFHLPIFFGELHFI
jgi:hypothetical protein